MRTQFVTVQKPVRLPETAEDWQLYFDLPEAEVAARRLTVALLEALAFPPDQLVLAWKDFQLVQNQYGHVGACDTEPRDVALRVFDQVFGPELVRARLG
jgi:hypothetical protein